MEYCCDIFKEHVMRFKGASPNIRIVKFTSEIFKNNKEIFVIKNGLPILKIKNSISKFRFFYTNGYLKEFSYDLPLDHINFCPFCGINLYSFYQSDSYANEIEGETFFIE